MRENNLLLNTDSYKSSHFLGYPDNLTGVFSYGESRGGEYDYTLVLGMAAYLEDNLRDPITMRDVVEANHFFHEHGEPFNFEGWKYIVNHHKGFLPLVIKAVAEGSIVPVKNCLFTVENTDPKCAWLVNYIETSLLRAIWYPTTVATQTYVMKHGIKRYLEKTSDSLDSLPFALLDFSARGCTSLEANKIAGMAYLTQFMGSDSVAAVDYVNKLYNVKMSGYSVPATEHSVMCSYGEENELASFERLLRQLSSQGHKTISVVSDTWDIYRACEYWVKLAPLVRELGLTLVVRPDSGDPLVVLPRMYQILGDGFGYTTNSKGYKVMNTVKILWGDGIDATSYEGILQCVAGLGFSTETIILGSGGGLAQKVNRDTCKFAMKASAVCIDGFWHGIAKNPITDPGKASKKGKLDLIMLNGKYKTIVGHHRLSVLKEVYRNGRITCSDSWETIKNRSAQ